MVYETRRRFPRAQFQSLVGLLHLGQYQVVKGHELGEGGMSFFYHRPLQLAQKILLTIPGSKNDFYCVQAEVRNCIQKEMGAYLVGSQFLDITFDVKREIRSFVLKQR
jgi:hypothetical protein